MNALAFIFRTVAAHRAFFSFDGEFSQERYKRFSELAIFMHYAALQEGGEGNADYAAIREHLAVKMEKVFPDDVFKNFYTAYHIIMPYVYIRSYHTVDMLEKSLDIVCDHTLFSPELPPHRQMEWDLMLYKAGKTPSLHVHPHSVLCRNLHLPYMDRDLVYALTHAVFYLTDFGFYPHAPANIDIDKALFRIACLGARFYEAQDVDVLLELVISFLAFYSHATDQASAERMLGDILLLAERLILETNFLTLDYQHIAGIEGILEEKYHTLFVLGILCALLKKLRAQGKMPAHGMNSLFFAPDIHAGAENTCIDSEALALIKAARIINALQGKAYSKALYDDYTANFGRSEYIEHEISFYLSIMQRRNAHHILWNQEFALLAVHPERQAVLQAESDADLTAKMQFDAM